MTLTKPESFSLLEKVFPKIQVLAAIAVGQSHRPKYESVQDDGMAHIPCYCVKSSPLDLARPSQAACSSFDNFAITRNFAQVGLRRAFLVSFDSYDSRV